MARFSAAPSEFEKKSLAANTSLNVVSDVSLGACADNRHKCWRGSRDTKSNRSLEFPKFMDGDVNKQRRTHSKISATASK
mmetsp:Transcript_11919/g.19128  ORF Transcript_11919/g.19128 Transcript_11919/m.19128 type:complete len:80 (+) Transcript_11919:616-855(+)